MNRWSLVVLLPFLSGCAISARSDKFGADLELGLGGMVGSVVDIRLKSSVGFSQTFPRKGENYVEEVPAPNGGDLWGFL